MNKLFKLSVILLFLVAIIVLAAIIALRYVAGNFNPDLDAAYKNLSTESKQLIARSFEGLNGPVVDYHAHLLAISNPEYGFVNHTLQSLTHPIKYYKFQVYAHSTNVLGAKNQDKAFVARIQELIRTFGHDYKMHLMAFDQAFNQNGTPNEDSTAFYVNNQYMYDTVSKDPNAFVATVSIHPYRSDAIEQLKYWHSKGVRYVKWLPNTMGIDPSAKQLETFYQTMKSLDMVLLTHTGYELAAEVADFQEYGNPLLLRYPLGLGVKIIMAHAATSGECIDFEDNNQHKVECYSLFERMMQNNTYQDILFADISAITLINRSTNVISALLDNKENHSRLVYGSDYPLPAINVIMPISRFEKAGMITESEKSALQEIYKFNPLLFNFVLMRVLKSQENQNTFAVSVFEKNNNLP